MMNIRHYRICILAIWLCGLLPCALAQDGLPPPLPTEHMRMAVYTTAFAKRFGLPEVAADMRPGNGLHAIEFYVEKQPEWYMIGGYACKLKLYVDASLPLALPEGGDAGSRILLLQSEHFFSRSDPDGKRWLAWSEADRIYSSKRVGQYGNVAFMATSGFRFQKQGAYVGLFFDDYHKAILPGLSYLKLDTLCPAFSWVDKVSQVQIWLKKEGGKDYSRTVAIDSEDFIKLDLPERFYLALVPWFKATSQFNSVAIKLWQQRRSAQK